MPPSPIGYEFLRERLDTGAFPLPRPAAIFPVTKVVATDAYLQVPAQVAPQSEEPIEHLQFAVKHEGMELQAAILALKKIDGASVSAAFSKSPSSAYMRQIGCLWEIANGKELQGAPAAQGGYAPLLDPKEFITTAGTRIPRWRVLFNGLGSPRYSPSVRLTPRLKELLDRNTLAEAKDFVEGLDPSVLDRAVRWSYLSETEGSYQIEREMPTASKAQAFAALLARAHEPEAITEDYLAALQQLTVSNPLDKAYEFRSGQNWLRGALPGALGVTYIPPPVEQLHEIMEGVMAMANSAGQSGVNPLIIGALVSFGFVYAHPFMDGNGRLSRFLFHKVVCASGALKHGMVLPISMAMKRHEADYLKALQTFSKPAREAWDVTWLDGDRFDLKFKGQPELYRYWDATEAVEFGLQMAQEALDHDLRKEGDFLARYDRAYAAVNQSVDMNSNDLSNLVRSAVQNDGVLSNNRIKQFLAKGHPAWVLHSAQTAIAREYEISAKQERDERLERLRALENKNEIARSIWDAAQVAIAQAESHDDVDWDEVHRQVVLECVGTHEMDHAAVLDGLLLHSPGVATASGKAALRGLVASLLKNLPSEAPRDAGLRHGG